MALCFLLISIIQISILYAQCNSEWQGKTNYNVEAQRVYYIACVEVEWDYAPSGMNLVTGTTITSTSEEAKWLWGNGKDRIGSTYLKALYREYTDNCFTTQKQRTPEEQHLGALGPNIRALTGENIKIFYKNMCSNPTSMHGHGVEYDKTSEGAPYHDGTTAGDSIPTGGNWIYIWHARPNMIDAGTSSKMWLYHSHVDEVTDVYAGLFGAIIITQQGYQTSSTNLRPKDIDKDFTTFFVLYDENESWLFNDNLNRFLGGVPSRLVLSDPDFIESNLMHAINGYLFGNGAEFLIMDDGDIVRWYTASFGNEVDGPHSPHWHGNIQIDTLGDNTDTVVLIPGTTYTTTMTCDNDGKWLYHCHVHDHIDAGMITTYTVLPEQPQRSLLTPLSNIQSYYCGFSTKDKCVNVIQRIESPINGFLFECDGEFTCWQSIFEIALTNQQNKQEVQGILCKTENACNNALFRIENHQSNPPADVVKVECDGLDSCKNMKIEISSNVEIIEIKCDKYTCEGCTINLIDSPGAPAIPCHANVV